MMEVIGVMAGVVIGGIISIGVALYYSRRCGMRACGKRAWTYYPIAAIGDVRPELRMAHLWVCRTHHDLLEWEPQNANSTNAT